MNHSEALWKEPLKFQPERFLNVGELQMSKPVGGPEHAFSFVPFGAGSRTCVGQRLAQIEAVIMLSSICKNCDWRLQDPSHHIDQVAEVTLGPKHGLNFLVSKRQQ